MITKRSSHVHLTEYSCRGAAPARGFTLIEIMVVVAIVAILTAIAIPSYSAYVVRGQRAAAKAVLLQTAQAMERYYTLHGAYLAIGSTFPLSPTPGCVAVAPIDSTTATYCISGAAVAASGGYVLSATPCGDSGAGCPATANQSYQDATCDVLTIDNTGLKGISGSTSATATIDQCWQH
jgi:type IV pilus assembly protein PilE